MINLINFFPEGATAGSSVNVILKIGVPIKVGHGKIDQLSPNEFSLSGKIDSIVYKGNIKATITLNEQNKGSEAGTCSINVKNRIDPAAIYKVEEEQLIIDAILKENQTRVSFKRSTKNNQTVVKLKGKFNLTVLLALE